ncbi:uncharacterized protein si:ch211-245h14.1 isoform X2 [Thunnus albacares]|uniref:uncharacterized protein si:ch211-245h14.1 isoform X2 n=1 Tax=Thunnus albacares TaxID=8236 RepID=UPI001CF68E13|nr:uncharacterized protein si:ch211-245h14.1 isoform X2 [Thunnus albacares]
MSVLLKEIKRISREAASVLEEAGFHTDSEIQSLTREDLHELFPGYKKLKLRKNIFEIIHKQKRTDVLLKELKDFIPHDSLRAALNSNGVLVDYLPILKEMKTQLENVQNFLEAHIGLLEEFTKNQNQKPDNGSLGDISTSSSSGPVVPFCRQTMGPPTGAQGTDTSQGAQDFPSVAKVMYQKIVSGKNFDADAQLLDKVKAQDPYGVQLVESDQDSKIIIVFCTISSRVGTDVDTAMSKVKDNKPVILVLMHHSHEAKNISPRTSPEYPQVVLKVSVFFHDTVHGLLKCHQNDDAASLIQNKLLKYSIQGRKDTRGNALGGGGRDSGATASATDSGGNFIFSFLTGRK